MDGLLSSLDDPALALVQVRDLKGGPVAGRRSSGLLVWVYTSWRDMHSHRNVLCGPCSPAALTAPSAASPDVHPLLCSGTRRMPWLQTACPAQWLWSWSSALPVRGWVVVVDWRVMMRAGAVANAEREALLLAPD